MNSFSEIKKQIEDWMDTLWEIIPDASDVDNNLISIEDAYNLGKYVAYEGVINLIDKNLKDNENN